MEPNPPASPAAFTTLRWVGMVVLITMVASIAYAGWLAISNWSAIRI